MIINTVFDEVPIILSTGFLDFISNITHNRINIIIQIRGMSDGLVIFNDSGI